MGISPHIPERVLHRIHPMLVYIWRGNAWEDNPVKNPSMLVSYTPRASGRRLGTAKPQRARRRVAACYLYRS